MKYWSVVIFILILNIHSGNGQVFSFTHYTPANGLAQSQVSDILQDDNGIIWIATRNGLSAFDGINFKNYYTRDSLLNNTIYKILKMKDGSLVLISENGYCYYRNNRFEPVSLKSLGIEGRVRGQTIDNEDNLWLIISYRHRKNKLYRIENDSATDVSDIYKYDGYSFFNKIDFNHSRQELIINYDNKLIRAFSDESSRALAKGEAVKYTQLNYKNAILHIDGKDFLLNKNDSTLIDPKKKSWEIIHPLMVMNNGFDKISFKNLDRQAVFPWSHGRIVGFYIDRDSTIWLRGEEGLFRISSRAFLNFTSEHGMATNIWSVVEDKDHNIWFASLNNSLQKWDGKNLHRINRYKKIIDPPFYMGSRTLNDGSILFAHGNGAIKHKNGKFYPVPYIENQTEFIYESPVDGTIMAGTVRGLVLHKANETRKIPRFSAHGDGWVTGISWDPEGFYWIVTSQTIAKLFPDDSVFVFDENVSPINCGYDVAIDSSGTPWFAGKKGLFAYDHEKDIFREVPLGGITVNALEIMEENRIMAGRMKDLVIVDIGKWKNNEKHFYKIYNHTNGFEGYEVQQSGIMRDHNGKYWISCIDRVICYDPEQDRPVKTPPLLSINSLEHMQSSREWDVHKKFGYLREEEPVRVFLDHKQKTVRVNYKAISTYAPQGVKYSYRINGESWSEPAASRSTVLTNLKPDSYMFEVKAFNADNYPCKPLCLQLDVIPAFWQRLAFKIIGLIIFTGLVVFIVSSIILKRQKKKEELHKLKVEYHNIRIKELIKQFDPHFTFNILSSLGYFILRESKEQAYNYLLKFSELLRGILSGHDQLLKTLKEEMNFIQNYCEIQKLILVDKFHYHIDDVPEEIEDSQVPKMIIHTFVENAIKHGIMPLERNGHVLVRISHDESFIFITISDNGKGRDWAKKHNSNGTGKGVELTRRIFQYMSEKYKKTFRIYYNDLFDDEGEPSGTEVHLTIPRV